MNDQRPDFNRIARSYRWLEYCTLGRALESCRLYFLPLLQDRTQALVLGDGDGRFLAHALQRISLLRADAVDTSSTMLHLLRERCLKASPSAVGRLKTHHTDALAFVASTEATQYDLVVTHFFLDCLTQSELAQLAAFIVPNLAPGALWLVSDFRIPTGILRLPGTLVVRFLYLAFRVLTGLRTTQLPDHHAALTAAGLTLRTRHLSLSGLLTTELWDRPPNLTRIATA